MSENIIITTTINKPTLATQKFAKINGWDFLVVGDTKTPHHEYKDYMYLHPEDQEKLDKTLSDMIGWGCIQRSETFTDNVDFDMMFTDFLQNI